MRVALSILLLLSFTVAGCHKKSRYASKDSNESNIKKETTREALVKDSDDGETSDKREITTEERHALIEERVRVLKYYLGLYEDVPPNPDQMEVRNHRDRTFMRLNNLMDMSATLESVFSRAGKEHCERFHGNLSELSAQILEYERKRTEIEAEILTDGGVKTESTKWVLFKTRLQVLRGYLKRMTLDLREGREGGYLEESFGLKCQGPFRDRLITLATNTSDDYDKHSLNIYGVPARLGKERVDDDQAFVDAETSIESRDRVKSTTIFVVTTAASIAFWEVAVARGVFAAAAGATLASNAARITIGAAMAVAESMAIYEVHSSFYPEYYRVQWMETMSQWLDFQSALEEFLDLRWDDVEEYAHYVRAHDKFELDVINYGLIKDGQRLINAENHYGSLEAALEHHLQILEDIEEETQ